MLKTCRIFLAVISIVLMTALFLDFTATVHPFAGFLAKLQFVPALLALNLAVLVFLVLLTLLFGRVYCSVLCPLGIFQDAVAALARRLTGKAQRKTSRHAFAKPHRLLRCIFPGLFVLAIVCGAGSLTALLAPYATFGRMTTALVQPLVMHANNALSLLAEHLDSYAFAPVEVWLVSVPLLGIALFLLTVVTVLAVRHGRLYCNAICPVGTLLGLLSRAAVFRPHFTSAACRGCRRCEHSCKSSCLDLDHRDIDLSRCVVCLNCVASCPTGALAYGRPDRAGPASGQPAAAGSTAGLTGAGEGPASAQSTGAATSSREHGSEHDRGRGGIHGRAPLSRRDFLRTTSLAAVAAPAAEADKLVDGGLAAIVDKVNPQRATALVPPGAQSLRHFARHCTGCQLCVAVCPNHVLRAATGLVTLMQPEMGYERGYCRPECTRCGEVCPAGAILPVTRAEKAGLQIGRAVWTKELCIAISKGHSCDNCAQHCPTQAITMVPLAAADPASTRTPAIRIPAINDARCTGCGACEYLCPARPLSAIHVEGIQVHAAI